MDDFQVHKQFPENQQSIQDDQTDNQDLLRRRTNINPHPAQTDQQEEPIQLSAKHASMPWVPDSAGCTWWSFLLLPPSTSSPAALGQWVYSCEVSPHKTSWVPTKPSHCPLLGIGGVLGSLSCEEHALRLVTAQETPALAAEHCVPMGQLSSEAAAALAALWLLTNSIPHQFCCHKCLWPDLTLISLQLGFVLPHLKPAGAEELFHHVLEGDMSPGGLQLDLGIWLLLHSILLLFLPFLIVITPLHWVITHHREVLQVPGHGSGSSWHHPANAWETRTESHLPARGWPRMPNPPLFTTASDRSVTVLRHSRAGGVDVPCWREVAQWWSHTFCITSHGMTRSSRCPPQCCLHPVCCSTTRNLLVRYFQTSPNTALITGGKNTRPYLTSHDARRGSCQFPTGKSRCVSTRPWSARFWSEAGSKWFPPLHSLSHPLHTRQAACSIGSETALPVAAVAAQLPWANPPSLPASHTTDLKNSYNFPSLTSGSQIVLPFTDK